ncbi:MAG: HlyC/CorC family transporter [Bauldia sp.]|nr:HlyC/CorC family transporter [Bauldia sp.]
MSDPKDTAGSNADSSQEPPSRPAAAVRPEETDRPSGEGWFDRLRAAVGLRNASVREELTDALRESADGTLSPEERMLLTNVLGLREIRVEDIMIPRTDIDAVDVETTLGDLLLEFEESGHSRMPVYRESLDDPVGMVHIKDLTGLAARLGARAGEDGVRHLDLSAIDLGTPITVAGLVRDVLFVPPSMPVATLLATMRAERTQMALVIDEYGGTDGLVSLEDAVEAIVGEIDDEHDVVEEPDVVAEGDGVFVADAGASLEDIAALVGGGLAAPDPATEPETIGGLVFNLLGRIPAPGEILTAPSGHRIEILDADQRRIRRLRISPPLPADAGDGAGEIAPPEPRSASGA